MKTSILVFLIILSLGLTSTAHADFWGNSLSNDVYGNYWNSIKNNNAFNYNQYIGYDVYSGYWNSLQKSGLDYNNYRGYDVYSKYAQSLINNSPYKNAIILQP